MATKLIGGGSSAVASSTHAACERFRRTDPLITGRTRRALAKDVGFTDDFGGIPEARWMRAMAFERLVHDKRFASRLTTTAVGRLDLDRPTKVVPVDAQGSVDKTADLLDDAHSRAVAEEAATMLYGMAIPFAGFESDDATDVKPDFAVVAPKSSTNGQGPRESWLIMGDAKDYERIRSRIDDVRLLKGFLQVALGAESADKWSRLPKGMSLHRYGALAVPRNSFLQPEAVVELLEDHREEVRMRVAERLREASNHNYESDSTPIDEYVSHLDATFDPASCASCTLFSFCRSQLRSSSDPVDLLTEIGVPAVERPALARMIENGEAPESTAPSLLARFSATVEGVGQSTGQARVDRAGSAGAINVVIAKSDSAALGVYGISTQVITGTGAAEWTTTVFDDPQGLETRREVMKQLGDDLHAAMGDRRQANAGEPDPVHIVVPDQTTADVLASIADNLAGIELARLRWMRDIEENRPALTYDGEPADIPHELPGLARTAVSFMLEEDRARALKLRSPVINMQPVLSRHVVAGGPSVSALRLDYLVAWAKATPDRPIEHRAIADQIEAELHTPGARLTNRQSDAIHHAFVGEGDDTPRPAEPDKYSELVREELAYKSATLEQALEALATVPHSKLAGTYFTSECDAQAVWQRRHGLQASDLVRFGRTWNFWRNRLVDVIDTDDQCSRQLAALVNPQAALESAVNAGSREIAVARVLETDPLTIEIDSRRIGAGDRIVLLHVNGNPCVESPGVSLEIQGGGFKIGGLSIGPLASTKDRFVHKWEPDAVPELAIGDHLFVADFDWFESLKKNTHLKIKRPPVDGIGAPTTDCTPESYENDPGSHRFCCQPHAAREAEMSDRIAQRRARGELNPETWPPVVDADAFEVTAKDAPIANPDADPAALAPNDRTIDDLD